MSLNWSATDVAKWDTFTEDEKNRCANFAWVLMAVDMNEVTATNAAELIMRMQIIQGMGYIDSPADGGYTNAEVMSYIGFGTNVPTKSLHTWLTTTIKRRMINGAKELDRHLAQFLEAAQ